MSTYYIVKKAQYANKIITLLASNKGKRLMIRITKSYDDSILWLGYASEQKNLKWKLYKDINWQSSKFTFSKGLSMFLQKTFTDTIITSDIIKKLAIVNKHTRIIEILKGVK